MRSKKEMKEKIDALQHTQAAIEILDAMDVKESEIISSLRDLRNARSRIVEEIVWGARL